MKNGSKLLKTANKLYNKKKYQAAALKFNECVDLNNKDIKAFVGVANSLNQLRRFGESIKISYHILKLDPINRQAYNNLFFSFYHNDQFEKMYEILDIYLKEFKIDLEKKIIPHMYIDQTGEYIINIPSNLILRNEILEDTLARINGPYDFIEYNIVIGFKLKKIKSSNIQLEFLKKIYKNYPKIKRVPIEIIKKFIKDKEFDKAFEISNDLIEKGFNSKAINTYHGILLMKRNRMDDAIHYLSRALEISLFQNPQSEKSLIFDFNKMYNADIYYYLSRIYYKESNFKKAFIFIENALKINLNPKFSRLFDKIRRGYHS
jgi:tetratricopeptide (TPR) repeat protein